ncbi:stage II sporulation protein M [Beggiatoa leptomitoformis]|uniref:Stage II sporulation protein M n=1 Tax=Beggiatoa leptomitoformis TaxID=288004 RepID=A0A2N9YGJ5_9GAMM|nr:stage II sporulation protein M [Beggiatoa leptomitoformis]ALG68191.1 stage II sporulation protein M [Beggiatoa leptomitoformis]AUI69505.1 stage II sporulation protein M [Beggiatoa leptomitoformis]
MKQYQFEQCHEALWQQLEADLDKHEKWFKSGKLAQPVHIDFPKQYREVCHHLALAKDRHYTPYLIERLNSLVLRGHQQLYSSRGHFLSELMQFVGRDFPCLVRQEYRFVWMGIILLFGFMLLVTLLTIWRPEFVYYVLSPEQVLQMEWMYDPQAERLGSERNAEGSFAMFAFYIWNNIGIGFKTFASGIFFGIGSIVPLVFNGVFFGVVTGHLINIGYTVTFFSFVAGHSALELTAIALSGGAGLKLGFSLLAPQRYSRLQALKRAAAVSVRLMYGAGGMLLLAAFVEAFWSSLNLLDPLLKYGVGVFLWGVVIAYFSLVGRHHAS